MKLSLVITVLNEEDTVRNLIDSIAIQSKHPDEIIFVDGGSKDNTTKIIIQKVKENSKLNIRLIKKKGSISLGRNEGVREALGDIILSTDAGCMLDKEWVKRISDPIVNSEKVNVVAGYYKGLASGNFQKSLIPYVLVMEDKVDKNFLPATRSMAFRKSVWQKVGGFNENIKVSEDYVFALKLKEQGYKIKIEKKAIVFWIPRSNLKEAFIMFFRFASGDAESGMIRYKVLLIYVRYVLYIFLLFLFLLTDSIWLFILILFLPCMYIFWAIIKNYKYVKSIGAVYYLPVLQIASDLAVISGTTVGFSIRKKQ